MTPFPRLSFLVSTLSWFHSELTQILAPKKVKATPEHTHKSRKERLEVKTRSSAQKNSTPKKSPRKNEAKPQLATPVKNEKEGKIKRRHTVNSPGSSAGSGARVPHTTTEEFTF